MAYLGRTNLMFVGWVKCGGFVADPPVANHQLPLSQPAGHHLCTTSNRVHQASRLTSHWQMQGGLARSDPPPPLRASDKARTH
eukprot:1188893-Prorocentrum_minimum.AAC.1